MTRLTFTLFFLFFITTQKIPAQDPDSIMIDKIFANALSDFTSCNTLKKLCEKAPGRLAGSEASLVAVNLMKGVLESYTLDTVFLQKIAVTKWSCNTNPTLFLIENKKKTRQLNILTLGPSVSTEKEGILSALVEVTSFPELEKLGIEKIRGNIVFFNSPMNNSYFSTYKAYGEAVDQRMDGASEAAKYGASAAVVRSMTTGINDFPHTGCIDYKEGIEKIPAVAISTKDAEFLSKIIKKDTSLKVQLTVQCKEEPATESYNLIADLRGSKKPDQTILVGAHIDCWYNSQGAHDDGAGCVQMIDVLRIFKKLGIKPNRTIRVVLYMDEEIHQRGADEYAAMAEKAGLTHYVAFESDGGAFLPIGFSINAEDSTMQSIGRFKKYFEPYQAALFRKGYGGVDIQRLKKSGVPLIGLYVDCQRYFDFHHCANDTYDKVNQRELQLGAGAIASLVYLIDKHGIKR